MLTEIDIVTRADYVTKNLLKLWKADGTGI